MTCRMLDAPGSIVATIVLPQRPFSPWLRLAHLWRYDGRHPGSMPLRVLADCEFILQIEGASWLALADGRRIHQPIGSLTLVPPGLAHAQGQPCSAHLAVHADLHAQVRLRPPEMIRRVEGAVDHAGSALAAPRLAWRCGERRWSTPMVRQVDVATWRRRWAPLLAQWTLRSLDRPAERLQAAAVLAESFAEWWSGAAAEGEDGDVAQLLSSLDVCDRRVRVAALARRAGLGETAFRAAVLRLTGMSPASWLEQQRMARARQLLADGGLPVNAVAAACGYADPFHFSRVCRRLTGRGPTALRRGSDPR